MSEKTQHARAVAQDQLMLLAKHGEIDYATFSSLVQNLQAVKKDNKNSAYAATRAATGHIKSEPSLAVRHKETLNFFVDDIDTIAEAMVNKDIPLSNELHKLQHKKITLDDIKRVSLSPLRKSNDKAMDNARADTEALRRNSNTAKASEALTGLFTTGRMDRNAFSSLVHSVKNMSDEEKETLAFKHKTPDAESESSLLSLVIAIDTLDAMMMESFDPKAKDAATRALRDSFEDGEIHISDFHALIKQTYNRYKRDKDQAEQMAAPATEAVITEAHLSDVEENNTLDIESEVVEEMNAEVIEEPTVETASEPTDTAPEAQAETIGENTAETVAPDSLAEKPAYSVIWSKKFFNETMMKFAQMIDEETGFDRLQQHYYETKAAAKTDPHHNIPPGYLDMLSVAPEALEEIAEKITHNVSADENINVTAYAASLRETAFRKGLPLTIDPYLRVSPITPKQSNTTTPKEQNPVSPLGKRNLGTEGDRIREVPSEISSETKPPHMRSRLGYDHTMRKNLLKDAKRTAEQANKKDQEIAREYSAGTPLKEIIEKSGMFKPLDNDTFALDKNQEKNPFKKLDKSPDNKLDKNPDTIKPKRKLW